MATIMARALTCPVMLDRVISGLRLAISQRRARTFAAHIQPAQSLHGTPGQVGFFLQELFAHGGTVLEHVGADTGFGFGVGGGVGVEADGFGGLPVGHGSREDQVGKGHFLISDWIADFIFGHRWLRFREVGKLREATGQRFPERWGSTLECIKNPAVAGAWI
jgi:hypothetical protein